MSEYFDQTIKIGQKMSQSVPFFVIVNPVSGKNQGKKVIPELHKFFTHNTLEYSLVETEYRNHAKELAEYGSKNYDFVVSVVLIYLPIGTSFCFTCSEFKYIVFVYPCFSVIGKRIV